MKLRFLIQFILFSLFSLIAKGQISSPSFEEEISNLFLRQQSLFPQEKTYLHIDRNHFITGDTVWFCGYAVDASTLIQDTISKYLYVDIQHTDGNLVQQVKVLNQNGVFPGYVALPNDLPAGSYTVSAYTLFMTGMDKSYFFRRPLSVSKPSSDLITPNTTSTHNPSNLFDVSFFPEGGCLLAGDMSTVGVKALNPEGRGEEITGILFDDSGNMITTFGTVYKGMGAFKFIPEKENEYYAICKNTQGHTKRFRLPKPQTDALALRVDRRGQRLYINVGAGLEVLSPDNLTLVMQSQGIVHYAQVVSTSNTVIFNTEQLPSGILHFLLLDKNRNVLSERLVFSLNKSEQLQVALTSDKPTYAHRDKVNFTVAISDSEGLPLTGQFSVSVTDDRDVLPDTTYNIFTELLLSSELKGYIEAPAWYFSGNERIRQHALDALMLTQGWRRYDVPKLLQADFQHVEASLEIGMELSGRVKSLVSSKASVATPVHMIAPNANEFWTTETDEEGRFYFSGFDFPDSLTFVVRALSKRNNDNVELIVDKENKINITHPVIPESYLYSPSGSNPDCINIYNLRDSIFTAKANRRWAIENSLRTIHLDEVLIQGTSRLATPHTFFSGRGTSYDQEYFRKHKIKSLDQFFMITPNIKVGIPGELGEAGDIYVKTLGASYSKAAVYIDNSMIPDEGFQIWDISFDMIENIEVTRVRSPGLSSPSCSVRIWLKKDWNSTVETGWNQQMVTLRGYQLPKEFYSPKYETDIKLNYNKPDLRTTIYWNPTLRTNKSGSSAFEFYMSDGLPTTYSVVIQGITSDGRVFHSMKKINCK